MSVNAEIAGSLIHGLGLMGLMAIAYGSIERLALAAATRSALQGIVFGTGAIVAMTWPAHVADGVIIDTRSAIITLAGAFAGGPAGLLAGAIAAAYRFWIGGTGAPVGAAGILISAVIGIAWGRRRRDADRSDLLTLAALGAAGSLHILCFLLLPVADPIGFFFRMWSFMAPAYLVSAVLMGSMMQREHRLILREKTLRLDSLTDSLTGLANRRAFQIALERELSSGQAQADGLSLLLLDIDHFKAVNDTHGHDVGDEVLKIVAKRLKKSVRDDDLVARLGGEEFGILFLGLPPTDAMTVAERIRVDIERCSMSPGITRLGITISGGVAHSAVGGTIARTLYAAADTALYCAKKDGRNCMRLAPQESFGRPYSGAADGPARPASEAAVAHLLAPSAS